MCRHLHWRIGFAFSQNKVQEKRYYTQYRVSALVYPYLDDEDERGDDGAPEHVVVGGGVPQRGQVLDQLPAEGADRHAHALDQVREHAQHAQLKSKTTAVKGRAR